jgi:phage terminase small subunit
MAPRKPGLSAKQKAFVARYLVHGNASLAAEEAGYKNTGKRGDGRGGKSDALRQKAYTLLHTPVVAAAIQAAQKRAADNAEVTLERVIREFASVAFLRVTDVAEWGDDGRVTFVSSDKLSDAAKAAISELTEHVGKEGERSVSLKLHGKLTALTALGKHLGMGQGSIELKLRSAVEETLSAIEKRLPPDVYAQVVNAVVAEMGLAELGEEASGEGQALPN